MKAAMKYFASAVALAASVAAGGAYALHSVRTDASVGSFIHNGNWYTDKHFGAAEASARVRAYVAIVGLLALSKKETVYYMLHTAEGGETLQSDGVYEITGKGLPARWWSITLYDDDHFLTHNAYGRYSVRNSDLQRHVNGSYRITLARDPQDGDWIPMGEGKDMTLILRMYNPEPSIYDEMTSIELPVVRKIGGAK